MNFIIIVHLGHAIIWELHNNKKIKKSNIINHTFYFTIISSFLCAMSINRKCEKKKKKNLKTN
jgi:hypothetical protein